MSDENAGADNAPAARVCEKVQVGCLTLIALLLLAARAKGMPERFPNGMLLQDVVHMVVCDRVQGYAQGKTMPPDIDYDLDRVQEIGGMGVTNALPLH